jgi:GAF domain-containing protein
MCAKKTGCRQCGQLSGGRKNVYNGSMTEIKKDGYDGSGRKDPEAHLALMTKSARAVLEGETDLIAALANLSAVLMFYLDDVNWAGFYLLKGSELVLGPFQGMPACSHIGEGKGVCGRAVLEKKPLIVPDVRSFAGHIVCDTASASEIVIPFFKGGNVYGVLDVDSPVLNRFSAVEELYLSRAADLVTALLDSPDYRDMSAGGASPEKHSP